ncbi:hypothetical protein [Parafrankia sp. EUN1f]|uniref:hypothetical protein n=1 Tax=Parafrankia sp. EUN1f TaxID=102897 RepID=UPI0001C462A5|nr:hypothetical protein [Parafrankia sp. EUN1f]EFC83213.1 hypothetical protein FrEUN1fDRAFT_3700 [Parafrankia sp. EUN1f]
MARDTGQFGGQRREPGAEPVGGLVGCPVVVAARGDERVVLDDLELRLVGGEQMRDTAREQFEDVGGMPGVLQSRPAGRVTCPQPFDGVCCEALG